MLDKDVQLASLHNLAEISHTNAVTQSSGPQMQIRGQFMKSDFARVFQKPSLYWKTLV